MATNADLIINSERYFTHHPDVFADFRQRLLTNPQFTADQYVIWHYDNFGRDGWQSPYELPDGTIVDPLVDDDVIAAWRPAVAPPPPPKKSILPLLIGAGLLYWLVKS